MGFRCHAYRRGDAWEAICTDLNVATFGPSQKEVERLLAEAVELHLDCVADLPDEDRQAMLARRAPWHVRLGLELMSRVHAARNKWGRNREKTRHEFVVRHWIAAHS